MEFSAIDNDLYKFSMQNAVLHNYPDAIVKYKYKCRNPEVLTGIDISKFGDKVQEAITYFCKTRFKNDELQYLSNIPFLKPDYIDFLEDFTFKERYIRMVDSDKQGFDIEIMGPWVQTILFEVPILYIISETWTIMNTGQTNFPKSAQARYDEASIYDFLFADFCTRRRASAAQQYLLVEKLKRLPNFVGTSNVRLAKLHNIKPIGTMAHEWMQAHQALFRVSDSQVAALDTWSKEYRGALGIALTDVVGMDAFLRDFDLYFAKLFDGGRLDSGNPYERGMQLVKHYRGFDIDPMTKFAVFSDGLDFEEADRIHQYFNGVINRSFGIGTFLTSNCGVIPLNIVIKMIECNGKPVAKVPDSKGKGMCEDAVYEEYVKHTFNIKE